jgi:predicted lipoprotein with Yx(FWY)xxD motif
MSARLASIALLLGLAACAAPGPARLQDGVLTDGRGMTLYTYDRDALNGRSTCNDKCAALWPPFRAQTSDARSGDYSVITRSDGTRQWAYKGKPLHRWSKDQKPGDKLGDGFGGAWRLARP